MAAVGAGGRVSIGSTGIVAPAFSQSSPKRLRLWLETTLVRAGRRTSMPSNASRAAPSTVCGSGVSAGRPTCRLHELDRAGGRAADLREPLNSLDRSGDAHRSPIATGGFVSSRYTKRPSDALGSGIGRAA